MAGPSSIEWTDATWNPVTGCTKISSGCKHCYAERMARRLQAMGKASYADGFAVTIHPAALEAPLRWRNSRRVFVNSMSDLFHEDVPAEFIQRAFGVMNRSPQHVFQILTKRPEIALACAPKLTFSANIWMGVTVEDREAVPRIDVLRQIPARVRFLSVEPLLEALPRLRLEGIHWVIVGGESGPRARPMQAQWVRRVKEDCESAGVLFFFKQWGGTNKKKAGRLLDGRTWDAVPV